MARTAIPVDALVESTFKQATSTAIDAANGMVLAATEKPGKTVLRFNNTFAGAKSVTIKAGAYPPAEAQGQGDLVKSLAQNETWCVCLDTGRFTQADGTINVDFTASMTGTVESWRLPQGH